MEQKNYAQFTLEEVFTPFFLYERKILEGGKIVYEEVDRTPRVTGIVAFDTFLRYLEAGQRNLSTIASTMGVYQRDLTGMVRLLTGMSAAEFISAYQTHIISLLLRYTDMTALEIARRYNLGTPSNIAQRLKDAYGETIGQRRYGHRVKHDLGRFLLEKPV